MDVLTAIAVALVAAVPIVGADLRNSRAAQSLNTRDVTLDTGELLEDAAALSSATTDQARAYIIRRFTAAAIRPFGTDYGKPFVFAITPRGAFPPAEGHGTNIVGHLDGAGEPIRYLVIS